MNIMKPRLGADSAGSAKLVSARSIALEGPMIVSGAWQPDDFCMPDTVLGPLGQL